MRRTMLKSKIHMAVVTDSLIEYEGSLALDRELMDAANLIPYERIFVADVENGNRFDTYLIEAERHSGDVIVNGAAARLVEKGDRIILFAYTEMDDETARQYRPIKIFPSNGNRRFEIKQ